MTAKEIHFRGTPEEINRQWHEQRAKGIGGSDVSVIMGVNTWRSIGDLWREKTGRKQPEDLSHKPAIMLGNAMEPVLRNEYAYRHPDIKVTEPDYMLQDVEHPWRQASLDGVLAYPDGHHEVLEIKTAGSYAARSWEYGSVPLGYALQVMHYMAVSGYERAQLIALIGNSKIIERTVERDDELIARIEEACDAFWQCVMDDSEPAKTFGFKELGYAVSMSCYDPLEAPILEGDEDGNAKD